MDTWTPNGSTTPAGYEDAPLPRRNGYKGMLPSSWQGRELRLEYVDTSGKAVSTSGALLDLYPFGPVLNICGARTALAWESLALIELVSD